MRKQLEAVKQFFSVYQRLEDGHTEEEIARELYEQVARDAAARDADNAVTTDIQRSTSAEKRVLEDGSRDSRVNEASPTVDKKKRVDAENFLKTVPLFAHMSNTQRKQIAQALQSTLFAPGERIVTQGEAGDKFYLITDGTVVITEDSQGKALTLGRGRCVTLFSLSLSLSLFLSLSLSLSLALIFVPLSFFVSRSDSLASSRW